MWAATSFFFLFFLLRLSLCCVGWLRSGTNTEQTLLLGVATLASKRSKDNALQTGGGHAEAPPTWPSTSETNEAKMGAEKEKTKHGSTKIKQIQTSKEDKLLREGPKKEREKRDIYEVFFFFVFFFVQACRRRCNRNHFDDAIFLFAWSFASLVFQIVILRVSVEPVYIAVVWNVFWFCCLFRQNFQ